MNTTHEHMSFPTVERLEYKSSLGWTGNVFYHGKHKLVYVQLPANLNYQDVTGA